jgi:hypothetical protein
MCTVTREPLGRVRALRYQLCVDIQHVHSRAAAGVARIGLQEGVKPNPVIPRLTTRFAQRTVATRPPCGDRLEGEGWQDSVTMPKSGGSVSWAWGWPKNQNRCCPHRATTSGVVDVAAKLALSLGHEQGAGEHLERECQQRGDQQVLRQRRVPRPTSAVGTRRRVHRSGAARSCLPVRNHGTT